MKSLLFFVLGLVVASNYPYARDATLVAQRSIMQHLNNPPSPTVSESPLPE